MAKANQANGEEISLPSFRDGITFVAKKPDADGFINILDTTQGPQGQMLKTIAFEVLKRAFPNVTLKEVGNMEFEDFAPLLKIGMIGMQELDKMGFQELSEK